MPKHRPSSKSPLDQKQKALAEQEEKLRREMERLTKMIDQAPQLAAAERQRKREEIVARSREGARRVQPRGALVDKRYDLHMGSSVRPRRKALKAERREARLKFFGLIILLAAVLIFLFSLV